MDIIYQFIILKGLSNMSSMEIKIAVLIHKDAERSVFSASRHSC